METQIIVLSVLLGFLVFVFFKFLKKQKTDVLPNPIDPPTELNCSKPIIISVSDVNENEIAVDFVHDSSDCIYSVVEISQDDMSWIPTSQSCSSPVVVQHNMVKPFYVRVLLECNDNKFSELSETFTVI